MGLNSGFKGLNGTSSDLAAVVVVMVSLLTHINADDVFYSLPFWVYE